MSYDLDKILKIFFESSFLSLYLISGSKPVATNFGVNSSLSNEILSEEDVKQVLVKLVDDNCLATLMSTGKFECLVDRNKVKDFLFLSAYYNSSSCGVVLVSSGCHLRVFVPSNITKKISRIANFGQGIVAFLSPDDGSKEFIARAVIDHAFEIDRGNIILVGQYNKIVNTSKYSSTTSSLLFMDSNQVASKSDLVIRKPDVVVFYDMNDLRMLDIAIEVASTNCLVLFFTDICFVDSLFLMFSSTSKYNKNGLRILASCLRSIVFHIFVKKFMSVEGVLLYDEIICTEKVKESIKNEDFFGIVSKLREMIKKFVTEEVLDKDSAEKALLKLDKYYTYANGIQSVGDF